MSEHLFCPRCPYNRGRPLIKLNGASVTLGVVLVDNLYQCPMCHVVFEQRPLCNSLRPIEPYGWVQTLWPAPKLDAMTGEPIVTESLPSSHPGKPVKKVQHQCPKCHSTASYLIHKGDNRWYCPECSHVVDASDLVSTGHPWPTDTPGIVFEPLHNPTVAESAPYLQHVPVYIVEDPGPKGLRGLTQEEAEEKCLQEIKGGMAHTVGTPPFHLIPSIALIELANQYALGEKLKGKHAWNALSDNQHVLLNKEALAVRLGHVISHSLALLQDLIADRPMNIRDAAAVMWGGSFAVTAIAARDKADSTDA